MSFGVFLSTICNTSMEAIKLCIGATLPHMLATGIFWPLEVRSFLCSMFLSTIIYYRVIMWVLSEIMSFSCHDEQNLNVND